MNELVVIQRLVLEVRPRQQHLRWNVACLDSALYMRFIVVEGMGAGGGSVTAIGFR